MSITIAQKIEFDSLAIDYGYIPQYTKDNKRTFKFKNIGTVPLIIENAQTSCGCLVASYKREPIMPNESSEIIVKYDTNRCGKFVKYITITSNAINFINLKDAGSVRLNVKGEVFKSIAPDKIELLKQRL